MSKRSAEASCSDANINPAKKSKDSVDDTVKCYTNLKKIALSQVITIDKVETWLKETKNFFQRYKDLLGKKYAEQGSHFVSQKVDRFMLSSRDELEKVSTDKTINIALVGSTGVGKSWIVNSICSFNEDSDFNIVSHGSDSVNTHGAAVTQIPTKIEYNNVFTLKVVCLQTGDDGTTTYVDNNVIEFEVVNELAERLQILNKELVYNGLTIDRFIVGGPFKFLKEFNISIMDIPGLSDDNDDIVNGGLRMAREADALFLVVSSEKRHKLEAENLNIIEPLLAHPKPPYLTLVNNCTKSNPAHSTTSTKIHEHLMSKLSDARISGSKYLRSIEGIHQRSLLFDHLFIKSNGFAFYGRDSKDRSIEQQKKDISIIVQEVREFKIDNILRTSVADILCALYEIRKDLENTTRFKDIKLKDNFDFSEFEKYVQKEWSEFCDSLIGSEKSEEELKKPIGKYRNIQNVLSQSCMDGFLESIIQCYLAKSLAIVCEHACKLTGNEFSEELFNDFYSKKEESNIENTNPANVNSKIVSVFEGVMACREQKIDTKYENTFSIFSRVYDALSEKQTADIAFFQENYFEFCNLIKTRLQKQQKTKSTPIDIVEDLKNISTYTGRDATFKSLVKILLGSDYEETISTTLLSMKDKKPSKRCGKEITQLKTEITKWFSSHNYLTLEKKDESLEDEIFKASQLDIPKEWNLFSVNTLDIEETDNKKTKRSKKLSLAITKKEPKEPPTCLHQNFSNTKIRLVPSNDHKEHALDVKKIFINFETEKEKNIGFDIECYENYEQDLNSLLYNMDNNIYPIFVPSKKRSGFASSILFGNELSRYGYLLYLVVEENELDNYISEMKRCPYFDREKVVFVSIPGTDRGVGFARSCIKMLQESLRKEIQTFNFYWTIDDDVVSISQFNTRVDGGLMRKSVIGLALHSCQIAMQDNLKKSENRLNDNGIVDELFDVVRKWSTLDNRSLVVKIADHSSKILGFIDTRNFDGFKELATDLKIMQSSDCWEGLIEKSNTIQEKCIRASRMSLTNSSCKTNYNLKGNDMHYRISSQQHACVLNYAPGLMEYNFLPWEYMLVDQTVVDREKSLFKSESKQERENRRKNVKAYLKDEENNDPCEFAYRDYFDGEDKIFSFILELDNRYGYQMYFFEVKYGVQKRGGCFQFRVPGVKY